MTIHWMDGLLERHVLEEYVSIIFVRPTKPHLKSGDNLYFERIGALHTSSCFEKWPQRTQRT
jgi:hypothetical protein